VAKIWDGFSAMAAAMASVTQGGLALAAERKGAGATIRQIQPSAFSLAAGNRSCQANGKTRHQIWMEKAQVNLKFSQDQLPERVTLNPEKKILMTVTH
jgi:hypothetical protein